MVLVRHLNPPLILRYVLLFRIQKHQTAFLSIIKASNQDGYYAYPSREYDPFQLQFKTDLNYKSTGKHSLRVR